MRTVLTGAAPRTVGSGGTSGTSLSVSVSFSLSIITQEE